MKTDERTIWRLMFWKPEKLETIDLGGDNGLGEKVLGEAWGLETWRTVRRILNLHEASELERI